MMTRTRTASASSEISQKRPKNAEIVERWFFTGMACAMLAVAVAGLLPSIAYSAARRAPLTTLAAAHGVVFFAWLGLFLVHSRLIATRHTAIHRRMGIAAP